MNKKFIKTITGLMLALFVYICPVKVQAEVRQPIGPVDIQSITKYVEQDGWSWDPVTKTLTLAGVYMDGYDDYSYTENPKHVGKGSNTLFDLPYGSTVIVKEGTENILDGKISSTCIRVENPSVNDTSNGVTFTGGGKLRFRRAEICLHAESNITFKDTNVSFEGADIPVMMDVQTVNYPDGSRGCKSTTLTFDNANVTVDKCTGGFYTFGEYSKEDGTIDENPRATSSICIKDSNVNMNVRLDQGNERSHHCFLIRNGYLNIDCSTLNLESYHPIAVVWKQYHPGEKAESLINVTNSTIENNAVVAASETRVANSVTHAETFVNAGETTTFSIDPKDMSFSDSFTNALKKVNTTAFPKYPVTFDALGGTAVSNMNVVSGSKIGELPTPTKENYTFAGWSTVKDATVANVTPDTIVTNGMALYAVWEPLSSQGNTEKAVQALNTGNADLANSQIGKLRLKATGKKKSVKLKWKKVSGATSYVIYGSECGKNLEKLKTLSARKKSCTFKKLKKANYYRYIVVAYKEANGTSNAIATSKTVYCTPKGGKYGNPTAIKKVKKTISVKAGKTKKLKPKLKKSKKLRSYTAKFRYESTKPEVATVSEDGVITGLKKGKSTIYVYAQNGVCKKVKVKVK